MAGEDNVWSHAEGNKPSALAARGHNAKRRCRWAPTWVEGGSTRKAAGLPAAPLRLPRRSCPSDLVIP